MFNHVLSAGGHVSLLLFLLLLLHNYLNTIAIQICNVNIDYHLIRYMQIVWILVEGTLWL